MNQEDKMENMGANEPCLFTYATSELSQDAFFAYLLAWADDKYAGNPEQSLGRAFLKQVFEKSGKVMPATISIEVLRQHKHIDVFCRINGSEFGLVIEDKVHTCQHDEQLERYKDAIAAEQLKDCLFVYCKTGDQSDYSAIEDAGYVVFKRKDMQSLLDTPCGKDAIASNKIIRDFANHIAQLSELITEFRRKNLSEWDWNDWKGFYIALQQEKPLMKNDGNWDYVANPSGGFMGFWWHWHEVKGGNVYLQLEERQACFKVEVSESDLAQDLKFGWNARFLDAAASMNVCIARPDRMRVGSYMTVAKFHGDYRVANNEGLLDFDATCKNLRAMEEVLEQAVREETKNA